MEENIKKEKEWVKSLCKKIKEDKEFKKWSNNGKKYDIYYEVSVL